MATRTPPKNDKWSRPTYQRKDFSLTTLPEGVTWAKGCDRCDFGTVKGTVNQFCTCQAGQARARWASGNMALLDESTDVVPTFNGAYGGV